MKRIIKLTFFTLLFTLHYCAYSQTRNDVRIIGHVLDKETKEHLPYVQILVKGNAQSTVTDETGHYVLTNLPAGKYTILARILGYKINEQIIDIQYTGTYELNFSLELDPVNVNEVVVSASKNETNRKEASTIVGLVLPKLFDNINANTLSTGLNYQPGVRVENTCQNCGSMSVRMNGLEGTYSQVLIDSRPIFSSLSGVYGLDQIPANMIERVEVVRGGGSALFGANAIAGTINIITREPMLNSFQISENYLLIGGKSSENAVNVNASVISSDRNLGLTIFGTNRFRDPYDAEGDGYCEISKVENTSLGFRSFYKIGLNNKFTLEYHHINEYRRGGDSIDRPPHETNIAEETAHNINSGNVGYSWRSTNLKQKVNAYLSFQSTKRKSYYGAGKDPNAYGNSDELCLVSGGHYSYDFDTLWFMPANVITGLEYSYSGLDDQMVGYHRDITQNVNIYSWFLQNEWKNKMWGFLLGGRLDKHSLVDNVIFSPRVNVRYNPIENINLRANFSTGFRPPQVFDEDLHISLVNGEATLIDLANDLKPENSISYSLSADLNKAFGKFQTGLLIEGFCTHLKDVFILEDNGVDADGNRHFLRTNGSGATVYGLNLEAKFIPSRKFDFQAGATIQESKYDEPFAWSENPEAELVTKMVRTPDVYGYFTCNITILKALSLALTGTYTGTMIVPHLAGYIPNDKLESTPSFFDANIKLSYDFKLKNGYTFQVNAGMQNIFNSYQKDFDQGPDRDASYIYGTMYPRTIFAGLKFGIL